jgi:hypothetical protein
MAVEDMAGVAKYNYAKGEKDAIKLFLTFPELLIENLKETLKDEYPETL